MTPQERADIINDILDKLERLGLIRCSSAPTEDVTLPDNLPEPQ